MSFQIIIMTMSLFRKEPADIFDLIRLDNVTIEIKVEHESLYLGGEFDLYQRHRVIRPSLSSLNRRKRVNDRF